MSQYEPFYDTFNRNVPDRFVPAARMNVSPSVYLPGAEIDFVTGQLKPDRQRRRRTQSKRLELERLEREQKRIDEAIQREKSKGGVRISLRAGVLFVAVLLFVLGTIVLYQQGQIVQRQKEINHIERAIAEQRTQIEALQAKVAEASDAAVICYTASQKLGMVPAETVAAIHLTAADTRPAQRAENRTSTQETALLTVDTQTTPVPMIASSH